MDKVTALLSRVQGSRVYIDTNIFIYFLERDVRYFDVIVPFFQLFESGKALAYTGDVAVAETLYKPYQVGDGERVQTLLAFFGNDEFITVLQHDTQVFHLAAQLAAKRKMKLIDALHYATAQSAGCRFILTNDTGFASDDFIEVIAPRYLL